jgi:hypothetical protein
MDQEIRNEMDKLEQTPLRQLADVLPKTVQRVRQLAGNDNNILHQGSLLSRLSFPSSTVDKLRELKNFGGSTSTWQWIDNPSGHRAFKSGSRRDFCRTLCTVETALLILANADISELLQTSNFVIHSNEIVQGLTQRGMWQLKVPEFTDRHNYWHKISLKSELKWQDANIPQNTVTLRINAFELGDTWLSSIGAMQSQSLRKTAMTPESCKHYLNMWMNLLIEEKTRQRVLKPDQYHFMEHDNLNLPWQYDLKKGYLSMPVIIWMKKDAAKASRTSSWVPHGSSSSSSTWNSWSSPGGWYGTSGW